MHVYLLTILVFAFSISAGAQPSAFGWIKSSKASCMATIFGNVAHGYSNNAYSNDRPTANCSTVSEIRTCDNGILSGTFPHADCLHGCSPTPWGNVASGYSNTAYAAALPSGPCSPQTRTCTNGTLTGTYTALSCTPGCTGTASWTVSSSTCSVGTTAKPDGGILNVTDSSTPTSGTATLTCNAGTWVASNKECCTVTPGSFAKDGGSSGDVTGNFTVPPCFTSLTVKMWGGGGGGAGTYDGGGNGTDGGDTIFSAPTQLIARGGDGGLKYNSGSGPTSGGAGGPGGTTSGGASGSSSGEAGENGASCRGGAGGDSPQGGNGGARVVHSGCDSGNSSPGLIGDSPGGGGGGAAASKGAGGGGAGGYVIKTYTPATLAPGSVIPYQAGGRGIRGDGAYVGGHGGRGRIEIVWQ